MGRNGVCLGRVLATNKWESFSMMSIFPGETPLFDPMGREAAVGRGCPLTGKGVIIAIVMNLIHLNLQEGGTVESLERKRQQI